MNNKSISDINLNYKIKVFEIKLLTYIYIYNVKYTQLNQEQIIQEHIQLERVCNIEIIYINFNNNKKKISKQLRYLIHKKNITEIIDLLYDILNKNGYDFDFINYKYELYNVIGLNNIYVIEEKLKSLIYNLKGNYKIFIFIKGQFFVHHY